ncbi:MAG TPA: NAD(P)-dependent oxidoreductase, partial [Candidatus Saccharimonadia bacterium]|nr:NAD(P)-dependent oxidoreductase [Candidatus Saccharimonadia bacterium]
AGNTSHEALQGVDLMGKTLGILGAGRIGRHMAQIAHGFGMKVVAFDAFPDEERAKQYHFTYQTLDDVLAEADVLSLHVPNLAETKHLLGAPALAKMKPSAVVINTARGEVIDTRALIEALATGRLAGAALDVVEGEETASLDAELDHLRAEATDHLVLERNFEIATLQKLPNVILTNHNAFNTLEAVERINRTTVENIAAYLDGHLVNEVGA